jgi:hypothetical protein
MWDELPDDILAELNDERFTNRQHYSRATSALKCHGPLCRKAERDRERIRSQRRAEAAGRIYKPNYESRVNSADETYLEQVIAWHISDLAERRTQTAGPR